MATEKKVDNGIAVDEVIMKTPAKKAAPKAAPKPEPDNMDLWNRHIETNPNYTKNVRRSGGFKMTTIDAYRQIEEATEEWGPIGLRWGVTDASWTEQQLVDPLGDMRTIGKFTGTFFYPAPDGSGASGSFPMMASEEVLQLRRPPTGEPYVYVDDEWTKKAFTNALTKALSYLGFNADIFMGLFDDNSYVAKRRIEENDAARAKDMQAHQAPQSLPQQTHQMPEGGRVQAVARVMSDEVGILVAKIQEYAMANKAYIKQEALANLASLDSRARLEPNPVLWLTDSYNRLISAVDARKESEKPQQQEITY